MRFFFLGERLAVDLLNTVVVQDGRVHLLQGPMDVAAWAEAAGVLPHGALRGSAAGHEPERLRGFRETLRRGLVVVEAAGKLPSLNGDGPADEGHGTAPPPAPRDCCCSTRSRPIHTIRSPHMIASTG